MLCNVPPQIGQLQYSMWLQRVTAAGVCYLLVLPAVGDKDVVLHLHGEVQPGEGMTQSHPQRRGIAGHRCHGSHFLLPLLVSSSTLREGVKDREVGRGGQCNQDVKLRAKRGGKGVRRGVKDFLSQWPELRGQRGSLRGLQPPCSSSIRARWRQFMSSDHLREVRVAVSAIVT